MISDKPLFGFGPNGFHSNYMDYQAKYFQTNPLSQFSQLADNVKYPFNDFVKIAVNYGLIGLLAYLILLIFVLWKILKTSSSLKAIFLSVFVIFIILSCFSYPTTYRPVLFLLAYFSLALFLDQFPSRCLSKIEKVVIMGLCVMGCVYFYRISSDEVKWKSIAIKSLGGKTEKMLPEYQKLYPRLQSSALFLYNYGAELNHVNRYCESLEILDKCRTRLNDYDLQLLFADNYLNTGDTLTALKSYELASNMIPCRFVPLFQKFQIFKEMKKNGEAAAVARQIVNKEIKIESSTVFAIVNEAKNYLNEIE